MNMLNQKYESSLPVSLLLLDGEIVFCSNMQNWIPVIAINVITSGSVSVETGLVLVDISPLMQDRTQTEVQLLWIEVPGSGLDK